MMTETRLAHRAWVEVDLDCIRHNLRQVKSMIGPAQVLPVVKSEAYGHGLLPVARTVLDEGVWGLGVVNVDEGIRLRQAGLAGPIVILGPSLAFEMADAVREQLSLAVYCLEQARDLSRVARQLNLPARIHIKVDTGLGRLSVEADQAAAFVEEILTLPGLELEGIYSHFADAEGLDQSYTLLQYSRFNNLLGQLEERGIRPRVRHISGSAAGMLIDEARLDLVRLGISLYGLWPAEETRLLMLSRGQDLHGHLNEVFRTGSGRVVEDLLRPALTFKTCVAQTKTVAAGSLLGYGCSFETARETRLAVLPVGYAEGYDRHLSNLGEVLVRGRRARVVGRICMNMTTVDITDIPDVCPQDEVVLIGSQGRSRIRAEEVADKIGTIHYEVVTRIPASIPRVYKNA